MGKETKGKTLLPPFPNYMENQSMNKSFMPVVMVSFLFAACAGFENISEQELNSRIIDGQEPEDPVLSSSIEEIYDSGYWVTGQAGGALTVFGIAGRRGNREEAVTEALADAARRVALYYGVQGESAAVLNQGSGNLDYFSDFDYHLNLLHDSGEYIDDLVFDHDKDVLEKNGIVLVRARYSGISGIPVYKTIMEDGTPNWVKNYTADIPGFLTAVSYAKNKGTPQKTYQAAYENAIVSLLPRLSSKVANEIVDVEGVRITRNISTNSGILEPVIILETWLDKKNGAVWTLLAARPKA
jgi:hypothetical protein